MIFFTTAQELRKIVLALSNEACGHIIQLGVCLVICRAEHDPQPDSKLI
jgi:hypothetical protein